MLPFQFADGESEEKRDEAPYALFYGNYEVGSGRQRSGLL